MPPRQTITASAYATRAATAALATNASQLGAMGASQFLRGVAANAPLAGQGTGASPLGVAVSFVLSGTSAAPIVQLTNASTGSAALYARVDAAAGTLRLATRSWESGPPALLICLDHPDAGACRDRWPMKRANHYNCAVTSPGNT